MDTNDQRMATRVVLRGALAVAVAVACFGVAIPAIVGVPWSATAEALAAVPASALVALAVVWAAGRLVHSTALTAALPGLTVRRALTMSFTGGSVANVLPVGGAAGIALNYSMARSWGFSRHAFTAYALVTNFWTVLTKMALPVLALVAFVITPVPGVGSLGSLALVAGGVLAVLVAVVVVALRCERVRPSPGVLSTSRAVVRSAWPRLSIATTGQTALLGLLLWMCLSVTGTALGWSALLVAGAVERLSTVANVSPGGLGVVELGLVGVLVAMGGVPSAVLAGVLLYRTFTYAVEIPLGAVWLAAWWGLRRWRPPTCQVA